MNYFIKCIECYIKFQGRASIYEFWYFVVFGIIFKICFSFIDWIFDIKFISYCYNFFIIIPFITVLVRRLHDIGLSGYYALIPFYNIFLATKEGMDIPNEYGDVPSDSY